MTGRKLGKEVLEEFMNIFGGIAALFQPQPEMPGQPLSSRDMKRWGASADEPLFDKYAKLALKAASELADFQSLRFAPVHAPAPPPENRGPTRRKFTISIFDGQGRPAPRAIDVKVQFAAISPAGRCGKIWRVLGPGGSYGHELVRLRGHQGGHTRHRRSASDRLLRQATFRRFTPRVVHDKPASVSSYQNWC
jgi:hypothetical protein